MSGVLSRLKRGDTHTRFGVHRVPENSSKDTSVQGVSSAALTTALLSVRKPECSDLFLHTEGAPDNGIGRRCERCDVRCTIHCCPTEDHPGLYSAVRMLSVDVQRRRPPTPGPADRVSASTSCRRSTSEENLLFGLPHERGLLYLMPRMSHKHQLGELVGQWEQASRLNVLRGTDG